jgi:hypothetical protein
MNQLDYDSIKDVCRSARMEAPPARRFAIRRHRYTSNSRVHPCDRKRETRSRPERLTINGNIPRASGVYFFWRQQQPFYIGQAKVLSRRLRCHRMKEYADEIGWLVCDESKLNYFESFYIGILRPIANFGAIEEIRIDQEDVYFFEKRIGDLVIRRSPAYLQPVQEPLPDGAVIRFPGR